MNSLPARPFPRLRLALASIAALVAALAPAAAQAVPPSTRFWDWYDENVELHGYFTTRYFARSPNLNVADELTVSSWRSELNLEAAVHAYSEGDLRIGAYGVFRPIYDSVFELKRNYYGNDARGGAFDPLTLGAATASRAVRGKKFPGNGTCVRGEACLGNGDVGSLFSGQREPAVIIDDVVFFGAVAAPVRPSTEVGGNADGETYRDYLDSPLREASAFVRLEAIRDSLPPALAPFVPPSEVLVASGSAALEASLTPEDQLTARINPVTMMPNQGKLQVDQSLSEALNSYQGGLGSRATLTQAPFDANRSEDRLKFDCFDNSHPWCFVRELYAEIEWRNTFVRVGRQQIVWGKTDAFRLQDNVNPIDNSYRNIFPPLEDRRIPQLSLDVIQSFGDVGPLQDVSLEFAWVFDRFRPFQVGQCGEPYAYTLACQGRADAAAHSLFNFALARVDERPWTFENTEPGLRLEFRLPKPSISFSLSAFYGFQDIPVAKFVNPYSVENPNPAALLFQQGQGLGPVIELLNLDFDGSPWSQGFDPYERAPDGSLDPASDVAEANDMLRNAWIAGFDLFGCSATSGAARAACATPLQPLALAWTASEAILKYPRVLTLGASADYQIPRSDTILRVELAYDVDRGINDTSESDGVDSSDVFLAAVGIDRPTYIPFLNETRTAFLSFQTFVEHVISYDDKGTDDGMVVPQTQVLSTFLMENYWRNDSLILRNFVAYDWTAGALATGPSFRWIVNQHLSFEMGISFLVGDNDHDHNIRDVCADGTLGCLRDPADWNPGQWQLLNAELKRAARSPWWSRQSFADQFAEDRDEFWFGVTYQF